jgi:glycosyltransferase involved in cell wall biosynthesis
MIDPDKPDYSDTPACRSYADPYRPAAGERLPAVSLVTPFYNTGTVFHETARSVFAQSLQNWEWLIVNDGSSQPEALEVLAQYRDCDARVRIIDLPDNRGLSAARNAGYRAARSEYVVQLDSDDLLEPTAIEKWLWFLLGHPETSFVKGYTVGFGARHYLWTGGFHDGRAFLDENRVEPTAMVRRSVHQAVGEYDEARRGGLEDWEFWLRCANAGYWGATVPEYLSWYRRRDNHGDRWSAWSQEGIREFRDTLKAYPHLTRSNGVGDFTRPLSSEPGLLRSVAWPDNPLEKRKPRLMMLVPWLRMGGADKCNLDIIAELQRRGWEVSLIATLASEQEWLAKFTALTPDVFVMPHFLHPDLASSFLEYCIESRQPDVLLLSHCEFAYQLLPYLRRRFPRLPLADLNHIEEEHWRGGGYPRMGAEQAALLDLQITVSEHLRRWMIAHGSAAEKVEVCYLNVDTQAWRPDPAVRSQVRAELGIPGKQPVISFAGRVCEQKQPEVLAAVIRELSRRGLDFTALVVGDGEDLPSLRRRLAREARQGRVQFLGLLPNERTRAVLQASDLFFLPSRHEGISLAIYEAMACGLAVVGADVGGQAELVVPECGILLPRADFAREVRAYADALAGLLEEPAVMRRMGEAARRRVEAEFPLSAMGDRMANLLAGIKVTDARPEPPSWGEALSARREATETLAAQWRYAWRADSGGRAARLLAALPLPGALRLRLLAAHRLWRKAGTRALLQRVVARLQEGRP